MAHVKYIFFNSFTLFVSFCPGLVHILRFPRVRVTVDDEYKDKKGTSIKYLFFFN